MNMDDPVLIAGGGGFLGGHVATRLWREGHRNVAVVDLKPVDRWWQTVDEFTNVQADLRELEACRTAVRGRQIVFDFAADMGGIGFIERHRMDCMLSVVISANLMRAAVEHQVERFFYASSACVYNVDLQNDPAIDGLREDDVYPAMPEDGYGWEKLFSERLCLQAATDGAISTRIARFHNVFGPYTAWRGGREKFPAAICRKVAEASLSGSNEVEIWGDGSQSRTFLFVDDAVDGLLRLAMSDVDEPLNLGSDRLVTINEVVDIVESIAGIRVRRRYLADAPTGVRGRSSNNERVRERLGWRPVVSLEDGLARTYEWVRDQVARS